MPSTNKKKDLRVAVLVAALVAAGGLVPLAYQYGQRYHAASQTHVAGGPPVPAPVQAPPSGTGVDTAPAAPTPPGTEVVPPEESEEAGAPAAAASAVRPTESFGHVAGLHQTPDPMHLSAGAAIVVDADTGQVLAHKNEQAKLPIASLTKLMTTMLVLEARQPMDEVLTITDDDVDHERHSRSRLRPGTKLTREEALHLALMSSENRAAHALGRSYPGGLQKMVEAMNTKAQQLGMKNTSYVDPTGLATGNQSTAQDLALLVKEASRNPVMREFSTTPAHLASLGGRTLQFHNSDSLVRNNRGIWDIALQKTGYIVEAGRCLTLATKVAGHDLVMVLLDSDSNGTRLKDAERLRHFVVAQNNWQDNVTVARTKPEPAAQRVAAAAADQAADEPAKPHHGHHKGKATAAKAAAGKHEVAKADEDSKPATKQSAAKKSGKPETQVASADKDEAKPQAHHAKGRVHTSFSGSHEHAKSGG